MGSLVRVSGRLVVVPREADVIFDFARFIDGLPSIPVLLAIVVIVEPVLILLHELGHAAAAVSRLPGPVVVRVGGVKPLITINMGRVQLRLHPIVVPWRFDGQCIYETRFQTRADAVVIALAGPALSLATGLLAWLALGFTGAASPLHSILQVATLLAVGSGVLCLIPLTLQDTKGTRLRTDGALVVAALRGSA